MRTTNLSDSMYKFLLRYLDIIFTKEQFNKEEFNEDDFYVIYSNDYTITITKSTQRILVSSELFTKIHDLFGVGWGDFGDLLRDYLSDKLDYDFEKYPTMPI